MYQIFQSSEYISAWNGYSGARLQIVNVVINLVRPL